jgi:hypothetical protein
MWLVSKYILNIIKNGRKINSFNICCHKIKGYHFIKNALNIYKQLEEIHRLCQNQDQDLCSIHNVLCDVLCGIFL